MNEKLTVIGTLLDTNNKGLIGFGHRSIKSFAEQIVRVYGAEWARKHPPNEEAVQLKMQIRDLVMSHVPPSHSNRDVVWLRCRKYALQCTIN